MAEGQLEFGLVSFCLVMISLLAGNFYSTEEFVVSFELPEEMW
jgi:hypothetical protein